MRRVVEKGGWTLSMNEMHMPKKRNQALTKGDTVLHFAHARLRVEQVLIYGAESWC